MAAMQTKATTPAAAILQSKLVLLDRIEEQLLSKFNDRYPDSMLVHIKTKNYDYLERDELITLTSDWIQFWVEEKPVKKEENMAMVLQMKEYLCSLRIQMLLKQAREWQIEEAVLRRVYL